MTLWSPVNPPFVVGSRVQRAATTIDAPPEGAALVVVDDLDPAVLAKLAIADLNSRHTHNYNSEPYDETATLAHA